MSEYERRTDTFQAAGRTVFLLEEAGTFTRGPDKTFVPELRNKVTFGVSGSQTFDQASCEELAELIAFLLNKCTRDKAHPINKLLGVEVGNLESKPDVFEPIPGLEFAWGSLPFGKVMRCKFAPRHKYKSRPLRPGHREHAGTEFDLVANWRMDKEDPYPGEYALSTPLTCRKLFETLGVTWVASGDVVVLGFAET